MTKNAQTLLEYVVLVGIITAVIVAMSPYLKRGIQSIVKVTADQLGVQNEADQTPDEKTGYLVEAFSAHRISKDTQLREALNTKTYIYGDRTITTENSFSNLGFQNQL